MHRLRALPRYLTAPLAAASAAGVVAAYYPGGLAAACCDLHDAPTLNATLEESGRTSRQLSRELSRVQNRVGYKHELIAALVRGEVSLTAVTDEVAELYRPDEWFLPAQRRRYGDLPPTELVARHVLENAAAVRPPDDGSSVVRERLRVEYEQRFGHPAE